MAWSKVKTTPHTCGGPKFGKRTAGCPRCDELSAGAAPVVWKASRDAALDKARTEAIRVHNFAACRRANGVCTCFDW